MEPAKRPKISASVGKITLPFRSFSLKPRQYAEPHKLYSAPHTNSFDPEMGIDKHNQNASTQPLKKGTNAPIKTGNCSHSQEIEGALPCSKDTFGTYREPVGCNPQPHTLFL
jgi:hypothetical protein